MMKHRTGIAFASIFALLLTGCGITLTYDRDYYEAPEGVPHARIRVLHDNSIAFIRLQPPCDAPSREWQQFLAIAYRATFEENRSIGMPLKRPPHTIITRIFGYPSFVEFTIPANYQLEIRSETVSGSCESNSPPLPGFPPPFPPRCDYTTETSTFSFVPREGKDYQLYGGRVREVYPTGELGPRIEQEKLNCEVQALPDAPDAK